MSLLTLFTVFVGFVSAMYLLFMVFGKLDNMVGEDGLIESSKGDKEVFEEAVGDWKEEVQRVNEERMAERARKEEVSRSRHKLRMMKYGEIKDPALFEDLDDMVDYAKEHLETMGRHVPERRTVLIHNYSIRYYQKLEDEVLGEGSPLERKKSEVEQRLHKLRYTKNTLIERKDSSLSEAIYKVDQLIATYQSQLDRINDTVKRSVEFFTEVNRELKAMLTKDSDLQLIEEVNEMLEEGEKLVLDVDNVINKAVTTIAAGVDGLQRRIQETVEVERAEKVAEMLALVPSNEIESYIS